MATMNPDRAVEKNLNHPLPPRIPGQHHRPGLPGFDPAIHGPYTAPHPLIGLRK